MWQSIFDEYGVITVQTAREMLEVSLFLSGADLAKLPKGPGLAVVTLGGERGDVAADLGARNGLTAPALSAETRKKLAAIGLKPINDANPVDLGAGIYQQGMFKRLGEALDAIAADPAVHTVLINDVYNDAHSDPAFGRTALQLADAVIAFTKRTAKAVVLCWSPASKEAQARLAAAGIYGFAEPERAVMTIVKLLPHGDPARRRARPPRPQPVSFDWAKFVPAPKPGMVISEHECHRILAAAGLPVAAGRLITSADDAVKAGQAVQYPVAMKGITPKITHRAAAGLLALNVNSDEQARAAFERHSARGRELDAPLDGVYMQHMESGKLEILVSALVDPVFGIMVTCGAGGVLTETIDDVSLLRAPFDKDAAREMLQRLRIVKRAAKIDPAANLDLLADFVAQFSRVAASAPWKNFIIEVNPVKWRSDKVVAVDGLIVIEEP